MNKKILNKIRKFLTDSNIRFNYLAKIGFTNTMSDGYFLREKYNRVFNKELHIDLPVTFNEKLQWLKLYDRKPEYTIMVDKYLAKDYVAKQIGEEYIIPTLGVWDDPDEIDFGTLPEKFVIKCNHNSGLGMYICKDKAQMDVATIKKILSKGLKQDYYLTSREWPYKDVPRKIIAEQYLENSEAGGLTDYKIHCFNGVPKFILVCRDRFIESGLSEDFYTTEWDLMPVKRPDIPNAKTRQPKPEKLEEMLAFASKLSENIPFLRVDFYYVDNKIYFSELTFFPASGFAPFEPEEWDKTFGDWLELPNQ